jgi:putative ABC transport system permease protein
MVPRAEQYSLRFTNADIRSFATFTPIIGAVFAVVGLLLIALSLHRMVHGQRRELGALLAMGYPRAKVLMTALLPAAVLAVLGAVVSVAVTIGFGKLVTDQYVAAVGFPAPVSTFDAAPITQSVGLAIGASVVAALVPTWTLLRLTPAAAMRGGQVARFTLPGWLRRLTSGSSPSVAYATRSLVRRPLLTAATVLSLSVAVGLGAGLNVLISSTNQSVDDNFAGQGWTATADLSQPSTTTAAKARAQGDVQPVVKGSAQLSVPGNATTVQLIGVPDSPALNQPRVVAGRLPSAGEILVSEQTAQAVGADTGGTVRITTPTGTRDTTISGIMRTLASQQSFMPYDDAAALLDLRGQANALYVRATDAEIHRLAGEPGVARVTSLDAARDGTQDLIKQLTALINVLLAISLGIGALFLVASLTLSFVDREREFATLRALGYGRGLIAGVLGAETVVEIVIAGALSVPAGLAIAWPLERRIAEAWFTIGLRPVPSNFVPVIAVAIALALLVAAHAARRVLRMNLAGALRGQLIG